MAPDKDKTMTIATLAERSADNPPMCSDGMAASRRFLDIRRVLVVDDTPHVARTMALALQRDGHVAFWAETMTEALSLIEREDIDAAIVDRKMPDVPGSVLAELLAAAGVDVVLMTADLTLPESEDFPPLLKPLGRDEISRWLRGLRAG